MAELKFTEISFTPGKKKHKHVLLLDYENGVGYCAESDGHTHPVQFYPAIPEVPPTPEMPEIPEQMDPMTGEVIPGQPYQPANPGSPGQPAYFVLVPEEEDGHTHYKFEEPPTVAKKPKQKDEDIIREVYELYTYAYEENKDYLKQAEEMYRFYRGKNHWTDEEKRFLESSDRSCLTINETGRNLDILSGHQRTQKQDLKFSPIEGGDQVIADILSGWAKIICRNSFYHREGSQVFLDAAITGRGWWNIYVDFNRTLQGDVRMERFMYDRVLPGPHEKLQLEDCEYLFKENTFSLVKIKQLWKDKADKIQKDFDMLSGLSPVQKPGETHVNYTTDQYRNSENTLNMPIAPVVVGDRAMVDLGRKEYRVLECWRICYDPVSVVAIPDYDIYKPLHGWKPAEVAQLKSLPNTFVVEKNIPKLRITKVCGNVVLSDEDPADLPRDDFYLVPLYAKKHKNECWGKVEEVQDAQIALNKRYSQIVDLGNKMMSYGYFIDEDTFPNKTDEQHFRKNVNKPGFVQKINDLNRRPIKEEGITFPAGLAQMFTTDQGLVERLMNISVEPGGANESGSHLATRQKDKLTSNQFLFDNQSYTTQKLGLLLASLMKRYYPPERIYRMLASEKDLKLNGMPFGQYTEEEIVAKLNDVNLLEYDVTPLETEFTPTSRIATQTVLTEMMQAGMTVPQSSVVEVMDIPESYKNKLLEDIAAQEQAAAAQGQAQGDAEIEKTLVAKGIIPPAVAERMGIDPNAMQSGFAQGDGEFPALGKPSVEGPKKKIYKISEQPDGSTIVESEDVSLDTPGPLGEANPLAEVPQGGMNDGVQLAKGG